MAFIRVDLIKNEETDKWDWQAEMPDGLISGTGFDTAQDAVSDAAEHEDIKGKRFYAQADKNVLFGQTRAQTMEQQQAEFAAQMAREEARAAEQQAPPADEGNATMETAQS